MQILKNYSELNLITYKSLNRSDTPALTIALKESAPELSKFIPWGKDIPLWNFINFQIHVNNYIKSETDSAYIFYLNGNCVGFGDIVGDVDYAQVAIWVRSSFQGRGIGSLILSTLEKISFVDLEFKELHYIAEAENVKSMKMAMKFGYETKSISQSLISPNGYLFEFVKGCERYFSTRA